MPHAAGTVLCPVHGLPVEAAPSMPPPPSMPLPPAAPPGFELPEIEIPLAAPAPPPSLIPPTEAPLVGALLEGRYRITGVIARGGMGIVYEGVQLFLDRPVAVKCLHPRYTRDAVAIARFQHEAQVCGGFGHPNIVEVFDMGLGEDGSPFLVMERLEGETVTQRLRQDKRLALDLAVSIARQTVSALAATHARGILHRDLKPDNLFLADIAGDAPQVKVLDFGVSKVFQGDRGPKLTRAGFVMGTPAYMAPEQARGDADLDPRVDLYAVGVILYEMLTGRIAYAARTPGTLLTEMQRGLPPRPSEGRPEVPPSLDALVMRCMSLSREDRPRDAVALQRELGSVASVIAAYAGADDEPTEVLERAPRPPLDTHDDPPHVPTPGE